jgi:hypothetical protein
LRQVLTEFSEFFDVSGTGLLIQTSLVSNIEHILALPQDVFSLSIVTHHWRQQAYAGVTVLFAQESLPSSHFRTRGELIAPCCPPQQRRFFALGLVRPVPLHFLEVLSVQVFDPLRERVFKKLVVDDSRSYLARAALSHEAIEPFCSMHELKNICLWICMT